MTNNSQVIETSDEPIIMNEKLVPFGTRAALAITESARMFVKSGLKDDALWDRLPSSDAFTNVKHLIFKERMPARNLSQITFHILRNDLLNNKDLVDSFSLMLLIVAHPEFRELKSYSKRHFEWMLHHADLVRDYVISNLILADSMVEGKRRKVDEIVVPIFGIAPSKLLLMYL